MQPARAIRGAGGGGGGKGGEGKARTPVESPDSLRSRQFARLIDLLSEGEIVGLVDGLKSVYLDDTPIQSADGTINFNGVTLIGRVGTQAQAYIPGFSAVEVETSVSTKVVVAAPVVRSISNVNVNAVRVTISIPRLSYQNLSNGDLSGTPVSLAIDVNNNGGGYVQATDDTISGKTTSRYQRAYRVDLPAPGPWDIRVRRITADSAQSNLQNAFWFDSFTTLIDSKLRYPNSALAALAIDSEQFNAIPARGYDIKGLKVLVPSNYNPATRAYAGAWDGTFSPAWTDNPAWCFYDMVTNERYGLGDFIAADQVDKWALYAIGQYCDTLVSNGFGGTEPRFTCNLYLQTRDEAYRVIGSMASIFRGMAYWAGGAITAVQDSPQDVAAIFAPANVTDGQFDYEGGSAKARHTVAQVAWNDPTDRYRQKIEYVDDPEGIARYGVIQTEILAVGCASRGQAHRLGRWLLYTERMESEIVSFRTGLDGLTISPGLVIQTTDPVRAGARMGGRVLSATAAAVTLDASVTIASGKTYTLWAMLPDGTAEARAVTTAAGSTPTLSVAPAFSAAPQAQSMWVLAASDLAPETWRVVGVTEINGTQALITALAHDARKFAAVETGLALEPLQTSTLTAAIDDPIDLTVVESMYLVNPAVVGTRISVSWQGAAPYFELSWRRAAQNWTTIQAYANSIDIHPAEPGLYEFSVVALNAFGRRSRAAVGAQEIYGKLVPPANVAGFAIAAIGGQAHLSWAAASDLDVLVGGLLRLRYTPATVSPSWSAAVDIGPGVPGMATQAVLPLLAGTYLAKWVDSSGFESPAATGIVTDAADVLGIGNMVATLTQHPLFAGSKTSVAVVEAALTLDSGQTIDAQLDLIDTWPRLSALGGIATSGEYLFASGLDLGSVQVSRVTAAQAVIGYDMLDLIDERAAVDTWTDADGGNITDVSSTLYLRTTPDNPAGAPVWSAWQPLVVGDYSARGFEFKAVLAAASITHNISVTALSVSVDMPDRIVAGNDIASGAGLYSVTYSQPFMVPPALGISAQGLATGDYYALAAKDADGFDITFKNAAGAAVSRTFDYIAKGY